MNMNNQILVTPQQRLIWQELTYKHRNDQDKLNELKPLFRELVEIDAPHEQLVKLLNF
jgi:hypothetical protein